MLPYFTLNTDQFQEKRTAQPWAEQFERLFAHYFFLFLASASSTAMMRSRSLGASSSVLGKGLVQVDGYVHHVVW